MRFGLVHRIMTDALAALGVLAVVFTTSMSPWTTALLVVGLVLALAVPEGWQNKPALRHLATIGPLTLFAVQGVRLLAGRPALDIAVEFAAVLQIIRLATRRGAAHDQQIIVLALLHFVAGTVLGGGLSYGLCFLGFLVVAPGALVLSHLRREVEGNYRQGARDRTGLPVDVPRILRSRRVVGRGFLATTCLLSVPIFLFTATLFVMFPRVGLSLLLLNHPQKGRMVGFSDKVDLGEVGVLRSDPSIALRFEVQDLPDPPPARLTLRMRGTAFDSYDGRRWKRTAVHHPERSDANTERLNLVRPIDERVDRRITIDLEPIDPPVVFLPPRTIALQVRVQQQAVLGDALSLSKGPEGEVRYQGSDSHGLRYDAFVAGDREPITETLPLGDRGRYLELPPEMPTRIGDLAHEWADAQPTPYLKAKALEEHLKHDFKYDTGSPSGGKPQPVDHFLFESKRGHCEFFSTAMAIMLRELGIPSRNVTGFVGGTYNRFGRYYAVREGDAHSWVEAYLDDPIHGWVTFDPTPTSGAQPLQETSGAYVYVRDLVEALSQRWNRYVIGYDLKTQVRIFEDMARGYERVRARTGANKGSLERVTRGPVIASAVLVAALAGYFLWKRRRKPIPKAGEDLDRPRLDPKQEAATALYRGLELALATQGISRPLALPPLKHAEELVAHAHPLAPDVMRLTNTYLTARFGGELLSDEQAKDFERRVRDIKQYKPAAPPGVLS
ncbi:MAG: Transglutaminase-like enzyme putative cysteine protease [Labilithrix sp.]|nr:Transglutaminase-like enzyme putative cysteine protease [Labilithrix sp.]